MYRHLMVPLDDSLLAVDTVRQAVEFARSVGARITFFHAQADYGGTSAGALERVMSPALFNEHVAGEARAILAKAEAVARVVGVPHESVVVRSDRAYEAILRTAEARGCDLVFIASHGRRGLKSLMLGSQTERVLQQTTIPVLVASVESNLPQGKQRTALSIIGDEHRSLAAVIYGMEFVCRQARDEGAAPSFPLLKAMLRYIREFPEKLHHPKEEAYLFRALRERSREFDETLDELEGQHASGAILVAELESALEGWERDPKGGRPGFAAALEAFASIEMQHMVLESKVILPAARRHLTDQDWDRIAAAFAGNGDPRFSVENDEEFRQLFTRIINLTPTTHA